jgi:hypothetical protein
VYFVHLVNNAVTTSHYILLDGSTISEQQIGMHVYGWSHDLISHTIPVFSCENQGETQEQTLAGQP